MPSTPFVLLVHGGAGDAIRRYLGADGDAPARAALHAALAAGGRVLAADGHALDAVEAAVRVLEDAPEFNAGRGAALTTAGTAELDAALMASDGGRAGAVCSVTRLRHPISAARFVMDHSSHVLMSAGGAETFALAHGAETADPAWFITERARAALATWQAEHAADARPRGTVGAVARDRHGRLAAATSTGGLTGKLPGRVGDSPLIGCGTYADQHAAISATGDGEAFIRAVFAFRVASAIAAGATPGDALNAGFTMVRDRITTATGGALALAADGRAAIRFSSADMARGMWREAAEPAVALYGDESAARGD